MARRCLRRASASILAAHVDGLGGGLILDATRIAADEVQEGGATVGCEREARAWRVHLGDTLPLGTVRQAVCRRCAESDDRAEAARAARHHIATAG